jgi:hypothetical protein
MKRRYHIEYSKDGEIKTLTLFANSERDAIAKAENKKGSDIMIIAIEGG